MAAAIRARTRGAFEGAGVGETDFAALKFARENTLLTNVEHYASSIREEAELYVRQLQAEVESLNQQADRHDQGEQHHHVDRDTE